jgi:hypothetical protein
MVVVADISFCTRERNCGVCLLKWVEQLFHSVFVSSQFISTAHGRQPNTTNAILVFEETRLIDELHIAQNSKYASAV